jgi:D-alanine-D-alanine ligase
MTFNVRAENHSASAAAGTGRYAQWADDDEEFDAPETVQALAAVLESLGHEVDLLGEGEPMLRRLLGGDRPELVLNFAEGSGAGRSREARVPAVLEMLEIPYTGSDPLTLAVTLDKDCAKRLVAASGVATPAWALFDGDEAAANEALDRVPLPWIAKPAFEGSSKGILATNLIRDRSGAIETLKELYEHYRQPVLVEEFIVGDELTVGLVGNRPPEVLGIMRVLPRNAVADEPFIYSLEVKRDWEQRVRYECPAQISGRDDAAVRQAAVAAWQALGCRDVTRVDFRLRDGVPYFLEANPLPGLSPKSGDLVLLAGMVGIDHADLVSRILTAAIERHESLAGTVGTSGK